MEASASENDMTLARHQNKGFRTSPASFKHGTESELTPIMHKMLWYGLVRRDMQGAWQVSYETLRRSHAMRIFTNQSEIHKYACQLVI